MLIFLLILFAVSRLVLVRKLALCLFAISRLAFISGLALFIMLRKFLSAKFLRVAVVLAVCALLIFFNPKNIFAPLRQLAIGFFSPFQKVAYMSSIKAQKLGDFFSSIGNLNEENEKLIAENRRLLSENAALYDAKRRNELLEKELNLFSKDNFVTEAAYVIGQDPQGSGNWVEVNKGENQGIKKGMPVVVSPNILAGKISETHSNSARAILLTNPQSAVSAITASSGSAGIVQGKYGLGMLFHMILQNEAVNAGDEVITSGTNIDLPRGLFIGNVRSIQLSPDRLFQEAAVVSPVQFSRLEVVFVIKSF